MALPGVTPDLPEAGAERRLWGFLTRGGGLTTPKSEEKTVADSQVGRGWAGSEKTVKVSCP